MPLHLRAIGIEGKDSAQPPVHKIERNVVENQARLLADEGQPPRFLRQWPHYQVYTQEDLDE